MNRNLTQREAESDKAIQDRWTRDAALRDEFCNDRAACLAFFRAEARGATSDHRGKVECVKPQASQ